MFLSQSELFLNYILPLLKHFMPFHTDYTVLNSDVSLCSVCVDNFIEAFATHGSTQMIAISQALKKRPC